MEEIPHQGVLALGDVLGHRILHRSLTGEIRALPDEWRDAGLEFHEGHGIDAMFNVVLLHLCLCWEDLWSDSKSLLLGHQAVSVKRFALQHLFHFLALGIFEIWKLEEWVLVNPSALH